MQIALVIRLFTEWIDISDAKQMNAKEEHVEHFRAAIHWIVVPEIKYIWRY